jgi:hypothetical protein
MRAQNLFPLFLLSLVAACVTVNVYFPAEAAESAARLIVRDVIDQDMAPAPATDDQSAVFAPREPTMLIAFAGHVLDALVPPAHAQANIDINTPAIQSLRQSMRQRFPQLTPHFESGAIGLGNDALVKERDLAGVALAQRNQLKKLVADENQDRNALYQEIARANGHPEWVNDIRDTFARVWVEEAPAGYFYQNSVGAWLQK